MLLQRQLKHHAKNRVAAHAIVRLKMLILRDPRETKENHFLAVGQIAPAVQVAMAVVMPVGLIVEGIVVVARVAAAEIVKMRVEVVVAAVDLVVEIIAADQAALAHLKKKVHLLIKGLCANIRKHRGSC